MDKSVDLLLRTGFRNAGSPEQGIYDCLAPIADVHEYAVGDSVSSALQRARQGSAPYIVFGDDSIAVSDQGAETLIRMLQRNRSIPGATLSTPALGKMFPLPPQEKRADAVRQSYLSIDRIPSWFCVLNRRLFSDDLWNTQYATLEFFLLELGLRLRGRVPGIFLLDDQLSFDARYWIKDLLNHKAGDLESDLARYTRAHESKNNHADVPPQFKIKVVGEFDAAPDTPLADAGCRAESPRFTIICPAYKPAYLRQAIESVLEQTYDDWELRILVDGPPEADRRRILEILSDYRNDPRIVVAEQENIGTGPTRRRLAQAARGAYLLTLDDDDMLVPTTLSAFASAIERYPDADFFRGGTRMVGLLDRYHAPRRRVVVDGISSDTFEVTQPFVIRRSALEELGGFEGDDSIKGAGEDTDLFLKVDRTGMRTIIIDRPLYRRRLSLCNQSLGFDLPSALGHLETIQERFTQSPWALIDRTHEEDGHYTVAILTYANMQTGAEVICPTRYFSYQTVGDTSDRSIDLEITSYCNAVCPFCPREVLDGKNVHMSSAIVKQIAEHLRAENGARRIVLCGIGEPTLHPDLEGIVRDLSGVSAELCITTNGSLMNRALFERLVACGLTEVNFSINAVSADTHRKVMNLRNFDRVIDNVHEVLDSYSDQFPGVSVHVSLVLCDLNQHEALAFAELWKQRNVTNVWIHPLNNRAGLIGPHVKPADSSLMATIREKYAGDPKVVFALLPHAFEGEQICRIARDMDFISVDGHMRLCAMDYQRKTFFGNAAVSSVQDMHLAKMLSYIRGDTMEICRGCDFCPKSVPAPTATREFVALNVM